MVAVRRQKGDLSTPICTGLKSRTEEEEVGGASGGALEKPERIASSGQNEGGRYLDTLVVRDLAHLSKRKILATVFLYYEYT